MSWLYIFTVFWFVFMSLSTVGKNELPTLPSAHQHARLWTSQLAELSRKHFCTPCPECDPCPDTHIPLWPPPCDPTKHMDSVLEREHVRGCFSWRQLCREGQGCYLLGKVSKVYWCEPGTWPYLGLPHPSVGFLFAVLLLYPYHEGDHHSNPQLVLHCCGATIVSVWMLHPLELSLHWNKMNLILSSFEREKEAWHHLFSL